jgi:N-acetylglucosamine kinase-like BadF-type ATPase
MCIEHPTLNARGKVNACWALDRVSKELGLEWEELVNQIEHVAKTKRRIKELAAKLFNAVVDETLVAPELVA